MKFACDRCGRSYSVSGELLGRTFKMRCKGCGHLMVVKAAPPVPAAPPPDENPFVVAPVSAAAVTAAVAAVRAVPRVEAAPPARASPGPEAAGAPSEGGAYVDLSLDEGGQAGVTSPNGATGAPPEVPGAGGLDDPFAGWKPLEEEAAGRVEPPPLPVRLFRVEPGPPAAEPEVTRRLPAPAGRGLRSRTALLAAGGVAAAMAIAVAVLATGRGGRTGGPSAPPTPAPARPVELASPEPPPAPPPAQPAAAAEERARRRAAEGRPRKERGASAAREEPQLPAPPPAEVAVPPAAPGPEATTPPAEVPSAAAPPEPAAPAPAADQRPPPSSEQVARIVSANRKAFESCMADAQRRDPDLDLGGRQALLTLTVNPTGMVTSPALDDAELERTDLGACLESAAELMVFPAFEGPPMKVEVPLSLGPGG